MRKRRVWRYYCDYCNKGQCRPVTTHEEHCTKNPNRRCRMCHWAKLSTRPIDELVSAANQSIETLRKVAQGCPACMLAGIRQGTADCQFEYSVEREQFWNDLKVRWEKKAEREVLSEMYGL